MFTKYSIDEIKERLKNCLSYERYIHSLGVMERAVELAQEYGLNSEKAQQMYNSMKSDTGRANLSLQDISNLTILIPPVAEQIEFEKYVEQVDKSKFAVQKSLDETQLLFDSLMQKYFG